MYFSWTEVIPMKRALMASFVALSAGMFAQNIIPAGTVLPVRLSSSLDSHKSKPGQIISAKLMQDVPLGGGAKIRAGAKVFGRVIDVVPPQLGSGAGIVFRFDTLAFSHRTIPLRTDLRALASMMEVHDAEVPTSGPDRGTSSNAWTTVQVGGDVVYRGGGPVMHGADIVGKPVFDGVLARVNSRPGTKCRDGVEGNDQLQALWVFSSDACGVYGFADLTVAHAGRTEPAGEIVLSTNQTRLHVPSGSGMLLRVQR
jgi:hypothetical protein